MDNPSSHPEKVNKRKIKNILLYFQYSALIFISFIIMITNEGERLSFNIKKIWPPVVLYLFLLSMVIIFLGRESQKDDQ